MSTVIYTSVGLMDRLIDFWDQPSDLNQDGSKQDPVQFATGVFARIEGLWAAGPAQKGRQQVLIEVTHRITIRYMAGLKSRMFIIYNDPDAGPRRFDIDRIIDPDEHKFELMILAIERNDGQ